MVRKGPQRLRLEQYLDGAQPGDIDKLRTDIVNYRRAVRSASDKLVQAVVLIQDNLKGRSAEAAGPHLKKSSTFMDDQAGSVEPATTAVGAAASTYSSVKAALDGMHDVPDDPAPVDPTLHGTPEGIQQQAANQAVANANQKAYEEQEAQATKLMQQMDDDNQTAVEELKKIHGIPDPPPPPTSTGSPQGPTVGTGVFGGPRGGDGGNGTTGHWGHGVVEVRPPTETRPPTRNPVVVHPELPNETGGGTGGNGGGGGGGTTGGPSVGNPFTGTHTAGEGSGSSSGSDGGLSGPATAGLIGGAGVGLGGLGGLLGKSLANRGGSTVPGAPGAAGKIGGTSRSAGSAVTGRSGGAAGAGSSGGRAGAGAGAAGAKGGARGGAGAGGRAGAGAGAGKAGGRGAGGRGGAGTGAGRGSKKDRRKGDVWDGVEDGDQWIDDTGAAEQVID